MVLPSVNTASDNLQSDMHWCLDKGQINAVMMHFQISLTSACGAWKTSTKATRNREQTPKMKSDKAFL